MTPIASILDRSAQGSRGESESLATAASSFPTVYGLGPSMLRCFFLNLAHRSDRPIGGVPCSPGFSPSA